jgi:hypothetical protein
LSLKECIELLEKEIKNAREAQSPDGINDGATRRYFKGKEAGLREGVRLLKLLGGPDNGN